MRTLKLALAATAAFALGANARAAVNGMAGGTVTPPSGMYQQPAVAGSQPDAQAFHAGGVAACDGCHVMHNAANGVAKSTAPTSQVAPWTNVTNAYLLQGSDQSSTCLICHSGTKAPTGNQFTIADLTAGAIPTNRTPGGDFGWLRTDFNWDNSPAQRHGHNVAAADFSLTVDPNLTVAPGGTWQGGPGRKQFACSSCHDPHGRYRMQVGTAPNGIAFAGPFPGSPATLPIAASGSYGEAPTASYAVGAYRLLGGQNYTPASNSTSPFPNDPPVAVAPALYNSSEASAEVRVAYGTGMSEWCQNCHTNIHLDGYTSGVAGLRHPAGSDALLHAGQIQVYNTYVSSGVVDAAATSKYTSLVPFEQGKSATLAVLKANAVPNSIIAAGASSNVMCLSCHRAHATAFDSMVRWDQNATFLTDGVNYTNGATGSMTKVIAGTAGARTLQQTQAGYYDRPVGAGATSIGLYQRSLCNKCHGKD
ncbi:cytochrome C [Anaeromyxobacter oryzae]|uniref:Cytochrome c n=1 Tax=Anaeromyxobacter oryzae TaxID=2918170 RepID=A0ABN6MWE6_9BACT|nr:cytochrome C [Anaeromyxobacter oryzae]BDG05241.1 cytochrome c [Anaeromyxobacter oryzae]